MHSVDENPVVIARKKIMIHDSGEDNWEYDFETIDRYGEVFERRMQLLLSICTLFVLDCRIL